MPFPTPSIDARIAAIAPGFSAVSIVVDAAPLVNPDVAAQALESACQQVLQGQPEWAEAHLAAWAEVFRQFGAKARRTPCSADALRKRVMREGSLPALDPLVDLYNAVSIKYAVPVGGENAAAYVGRPRLTFADGSEVFDTIKEGLPVQEHPEPGEVVWRDDSGVTCRRWNWRQGLRTRLDSQATRMWFILESLPPMPPAALHDAAWELTAGLQAMMPGCRIMTESISYPQAERQPD